MNLTKTDQGIHRHEIAFRGLETFEKRSEPLILICGAGALGSNLLNLISRLGFTNLRIIDKDKVELHNTANQLYGRSDVGAAKVRACSNKMLREVGCRIDAIQQELNESNTKKIFKGANLIVDTFDNFESRRVIKEASITLNIPCIHAGMSDSGFSEIKWNTYYNIPKIEVEQNDVCEYPLAVNLVHFTVCLLSEAICEYFDKDKKINIDFTLNDLKISRREI